MVPKTGVEPVRYRYHGILSPACLPIPPLRQLELLYHRQDGNAIVFSQKFSVIMKNNYCFFPFIRLSFIKIQKMEFGV